MKAQTFEDHLITVEDAQSGYLFHFAVGATKGFRYLGVQSTPPQPVSPQVDPTVLEAATVTARDLAKSEGWL